MKKFMLVLLVLSTLSSGAAYADLYCADYLGFITMCDEVDIDCDKTYPDGTTSADNWAEIIDESWTTTNPQCIDTDAPNPAPGNKMDKNDLTPSFLSFTERDFLYTTNEFYKAINIPEVQQLDTEYYGECPRDVENVCK